MRPRPAAAAAWTVVAFGLICAALAGSVVLLVMQSLSGGASIVNQPVRDHAGHDEARGDREEARVAPLEPGRAADSANEEPSDAAGEPQTDGLDIPRPTFEPPPIREDAGAGPHEPIRDGDRPEPPGSFTAPPPVHWADQAESRRLAERLATAQAALSDSADHPDAWREAADAAIAASRWALGVRYLARVVELAPDDARAHFDHAAALLRLGRWTEAIRSLESVVQLKPDWHEAWSNRPAGSAGSAGVGRGRGAEVGRECAGWRAAADDLRSVLEHDPADATAALNLSLALEQLDELDAARGVLRNLLVRHPRHVPVLERLAELSWSAWQRSAGTIEADRAEAIGCWRAVLAIQPHRHDIVERLREAGAPPQR